MSNKCIFMVHVNWQIGGVERTNLQWAKILAANDFDVFLINIAKCYDFNLEKEDHDFVEAVNVKSYEAAVKYLKENCTRSDKIIICQPFVLRRLFLRLLRIRCINKKHCFLAIRNSFEQYGSRHFARLTISLLIYIFCLFGGRVITNSTETSTEKPLRYIKNVDVVINPRFDKVPDLPTGVKPGTFPKEIVFIGRWSQQKGIDVVSDFAQLCADQKIPFAAYCGADNLDFQKPFLPDVLHYLSHNNVALLFCSEFEGYPNILVEARCMGIPVLYRECKTGVREIMEGYGGAVRVSDWDRESTLEGLNTVLKTERQIPEMDFIEKHLVSNSKLSQVVR